jgi:hypothetical protein
MNKLYDIRDIVEQESPKHIILGILQNIGNERRGIMGLDDVKPNQVYCSGGENSF